MFPLESLPWKQRWRKLKKDPINQSEAAPDSRPTQSNNLIPWKPQQSESSRVTADFQEMFQMYSETFLNWSWISSWFQVPAADPEPPNNFFTPFLKDLKGFWRSPVKIFYSFGTKKWIYKNVLNVNGNISIEFELHFPWCTGSSSSSISPPKISDQEVL